MKLFGPTLCKSRPANLNYQPRILAVPNLMDQLMGEGLSARAEGKGGDQLGAAVTRDP